MTRNAGFEAERKLLELVENAGKAVTFKKLDGSERTFSVENVYHFGHSTKSKVDLVINPSTRLQVKSSRSNRASIINMVPVRNWEKLAKREMMDVFPVYDAMLKYDAILQDWEKYTGKKRNEVVYLADIAKKEDWREIINYFLFEGTSTYQADSHMQANFLLEDTGNGWLLIEKQEAADYIWEKMVFEIRRRKGKTENCVHIRITK